MSFWYQAKLKNITPSIDKKCLDILLGDNEDGNIWVEIEIKHLNNFVIGREIIICAAVKTPSGLIVRGHRHCDCYHNISLRPEYRDPDKVGRCDEGFITSRNRYVGREEALKLQIEAGIKSADPGGYRRDVLFSEDLY